MVILFKLRKGYLGYISANLFLILVCFIIITPLIWSVSTSFKSRSEVFAHNFTLIPKQVIWQNYVEIIKAAPFGQYLINTVLVVTGILILQLLLIIPAAYAFAKLEFPGKSFLFFIFIAQMLLPLQSIIVPNYLFLKNLGLINTRIALILPFAASGYGIFLIRQTFKQIPEALIDSARIDGCGDLRVIWHIMIPLAKPTITAFSLISIVIHWNDYFWPLIVTNTADVRTLAIGLGMFVQQESGADWPLLMAGTMFIVLPILLFFLCTQNVFINNLIKSGLKE
ncbi:carbohydrate ABC transporter permease [Halocella sp. SP3-1]|nr:carbohydrate ABC transporter permease [Halocella sp. SP3-1]MTI59546.1 carbohydrate ABC transporter permease [Bacillota bacterium]